MVPDPPPAPPLIDLDGKALLDFIAGQNQKERDYFDRLLKWFGSGIAIVLAVFTGLFTFFGYQNYKAVQNVSEELRAETRMQLVKAVKEELTREKIQDQIEKALREKTEAQFQEAIGRAITVELDKPKRQKALEAATRRQVDTVTKHLQDREKILHLGDAAISEGEKSGPALLALRELWKTSPNEDIRDAARAEIAHVANFWGANSYLPESYQITKMNGKQVKEQELTTCDLLTMLRSGDWKDRRRSTDLLLRQEKGVPEALIDATTDACLEVATRSRRTLENIIRTPNFPSSTLPDSEEIHEWWVKEGRNMAAKFEPPKCKVTP